MDDVDGRVEGIVLAFTHRLIEVGRQMGEARDPRAFAATERELLQMARDLDITGWRTSARSPTHAA